MGETCCVKTSLIFKLNQLLNNGEKSIEKIEIYQSIRNEEICKK